MNPILVAGTDSWEGDDVCKEWFCPGSPFGQFMNGLGLTCSYDWDNRGAKPFIWSTNLSGVPFFTRGNHTDWKAGGAALSYFAAGKSQRPGDKTAVIAHSHGLQVVLYACADHDLKVGTLISVGSPVRTDMMCVAKRARGNIGTWIHVHSDRSDRWQWFGELFDGHFGIVREHPLADRNDSVPGVGHGTLLRQPQHFHYWVDRKWVDSMKG